MGKPNEARCEAILSSASTSVLGIRNAADCGIVQAHGMADFGETIAVVTMGSANGVVASRPVASGLGSKELAQHRSGGKPLPSGNLLQETLISQPRRQPLNKPLAPE